MKTLDGESLARTALHPTLKGAVTIKEFSKKYGDPDLSQLVGELSDQTKAVNDGDLQRAEGMLMVQAQTLDAIFNNLAMRAAGSEYMDNFERFLRLALRAQSQCRATLETLSEVKNPRPIAYVQQANIGYNQQVNNRRAGVTAGSSPKNKILGELPQ